MQIQYDCPISCMFSIMRRLDQSSLHPLIKHDMSRPGIEPELRGGRKVLYQRTS